MRMYMYIYKYLFIFIFKRKKKEKNMEVNLGGFQNIYRLLVFTCIEYNTYIVTYIPNWKIVFELIDTYTSHPSPSPITEGKKKKKFKPCLIG